MNILGKIFRKTPPIGLDIGADGVRMIQLEAVGKAMTARAAARCKFPVGILEDIEACREFAIDAVRRFIKDGDFVGRNVVTCLGADELHIKQTRLAKMNEKQRQSAIRLEAAEKFGFEPAAGMAHYLIAAEVRNGSDVKDELILMAAREQQVEQHVQMIDQMGLVPVCVDAEPVSVFRPFERFLRRGGDTETVEVIVDIGGCGTWVIFSRGRKIGFVKDINIGGFNFTRAVANALDIDFGQAATLRRQYMTNPEEVGDQVQRAVYEAVRPVAEQLTREISLCLRYCSVNFRGSRPENVKLVGIQARDSIVRDLLNEYINIECVTGWPLKHIDISGVDLGGDHRGDLCDWAVATGLALRDIMEDQDRKESENEPNKLSA